MIVVVHEFPEGEEGATLSVVDLEKLDQSSTYRRAVEHAIDSGTFEAEITPEEAAAVDESAIVTPPCQIDAVVTFYPPEKEVEG